MIEAKLWNFRAVFEITDKQRKNEHAVNTKVFHFSLKPHSEVEFKGNNYETERINFNCSHCSHFFFFNLSVGRTKVFWYIDIYTFHSEILLIFKIFYITLMWLKPLLVFIKGNFFCH